MAAALRCSRRDVPQARAHHRDRRSGRIAPRRAARSPRGTTSSVSCGSRSRAVSRTSTAIRDRIELIQADVLDELSLVDVLDDLPAARGLQPRVAVVRPDVVAAARADRGVRGRRLHGAARGDPSRRRRDSLLPGVLQRDLRRAAGGAADGGDAARAGHAVRRREGLRALHHARATGGATGCTRRPGSSTTTSRRGGRSTS